MRDAKSSRLAGLACNLVVRQIGAFAACRCSTPAVCQPGIDRQILISGHPGTAEGLDAYLAFLPRNHPVAWAVTYIGGSMDRLLDKIILAGGHIQVGLGDYHYRGISSPTNAHVIANVVRRATEFRATRRFRIGCAAYIAAATLRDDRVTWLQGHQRGTVQAPAEASGALPQSRRTRSPRRAPRLDFQPRYARVAQSLIEDIAAGKFPVGSLIATEADLCERFGVSRNTARAALAVLSDMGLVTRHAGHRHFCPQCDRGCPLCSGSRIGFRAISEYRGDRAADTVGTHGRCRHQPPKLLDCRRGEQWKQVELLRSIRKHQLPVAYSHLYLPPHLANLSKHFDRLRAPAYTVIDRKSKSRVFKMFQETSACPVPKIAARRLGVAERSPGMQIIRRYSSEDAKTVLISKTIYPAGRYSFSFAIKLLRSYGWSAT